MTHFLTLFATAAFGRLCVETSNGTTGRQLSRTAAFGRLCVETTLLMRLHPMIGYSRLRAAVC
ncbi:hypothetical protein l11_12940 [Neisseria weaveri LMG 5135]|nr:hypothetical protein l11_12940 [Neisseria weaveri LMG 5135]